VVDRHRTELFCQLKRNLQWRYSRQFVRQGHPLLKHFCRFCQCGCRIRHQADVFVALPRANEKEKLLYHFAVYNAVLRNILKSTFRVNASVYSAVCSTH